MRPMRVFRSLRPLRLIARTGGLRLVVSCIIASLKPCLNVMVLCALVFLVFAIVGINLFKGQFSSCYKSLSWDAEPVETFAPLVRGVLGKERRVGDWLDCIGGAGGVWKEATVNFDNVWSAINLLFHSATSDWLTPFDMALDSNGMGMSPVTMNHRVIPTIFFVVFIVIASFFTLEIFTGVIIENYNRSKEEADHNSNACMCTPRQQVRVHMGMCDVVGTYISRLVHLLSSCCNARWTISSVSAGKSVCN